MLRGVRRAGGLPLLANYMFMCWGHKAKNGKTIVLKTNKFWSWLEFAHRCDQRTSKWNSGLWRSNKVKHLHKMCRECTVILPSFFFIIISTMLCIYPTNFTFRTTYLFDQGGRWLRSRMLSSSWGTPPVLHWSCPRRASTVGSRCPPAHWRFVFHGSTGRSLRINRTYHGCGSVS